MDKDLKIGNLFYYGDRLAEVSAIHRTHFYCEEYKTRIAFGNSIQLSFKPIPLTEEWLLKFGFERMPRNSEYDYNLDNFHLNIDPDLENGYWVEGLGLMQSFQYVHQLQNLYFALTGEELTIKED